MSPERKDDEPDGRESSPADREGGAEPPRAKSPKTGKTKATANASGDNAKPEQTAAREAAGSSTVERPPRAATKKAASSSVRSCLTRPPSKPCSTTSAWCRSTSSRQGS